MKKFFLMLALAAFPFTSAFALPSYDDDVVTFDVLSHFNFGFHGLNPGADPSFALCTNFARSGEIGLNLVEIGVRPYHGGTFSLGVDLNWDNYRLWKSFYWEVEPVDGTVRVAPATAFESIRKSVLRVLSFEFPLEFTQTIGEKLDLTVGASAELNFAGSTHFRATDASGNVIRNGNYHIANIKTHIFTYNFHAAISYRGIGLYAKYSPVPQFAEGFGPQFTTWTTGIIFRIPKW